MIVLHTYTYIYIYLFMYLSIYIYININTQQFFLVLKSDWLRGVWYSSDNRTATISLFVSLHYNFINNNIFVSQNVVLRVF